MKAKLLYLLLFLLNGCLLGQTLELEAEAEEAKAHFAGEVYLYTLPHEPQIAQEKLISQFKPDVCFFQAEKPALVGRLFTI